MAILIDSNHKLRGNVANIAWNHQPLDYLDSWTQRLTQVSLTGIRVAFARKLQPDKMVISGTGGVRAKQRTMRSSKRTKLA